MHVEILTDNKAFIYIISALVALLEVISVVVGQAYQRGVSPFQPPACLKVDEVSYLASCCFGIGVKVGIWQMLIGRRSLDSHLFNGDWPFIGLTVHDFKTKQGMFEAMSIRLQACLVNGYLQLPI